MDNPFAVRKPENQWVLPVSLLALIVSFLASFAWIDTRNRTGRIANLPVEQRQRLSLGTLDLSSENETLRNDIAKLRQENTKLQNAVAQNSNASQALNKSLQETKLFAGLTDVQGPGVAVLLKDSHGMLQGVGSTPGQIIHDTDVLRVVNELKNAGAEAISVNNRRVGPLTNFRCVGTTILVDDAKVASPVTVRAIGDSDTLYGAMNLPGGILEEIRLTDPKMVEVEPVQHMVIPAYKGTSTFKTAAVAEDKK